MKFGTFDISNIPISTLMSQIIFIKYLPPVRLQICTKIKSVQTLLKLGTFDVSNMQISILKLKKIFVKYLPPVRPKLIPKLKMLIKTIFDIKIEISIFEISSLPDFNKF